MLKRAWLKETGNSFHVASSLFYTSSTVLAGEGWEASLNNLWPDVSVSDRSGEHVGQGSNQLTCVSGKLRTKSATCGHALSCWKMTFDRPLRQSIIIGRKMSEMYQLVFKLPSIRTRNVRLLYPIAALTITLDAVPLCRCL